MPASGLVEVANHLSDRAVALNGAVADAYGRSAFNRYYYSGFLAVRELLILLDPKWARQSHANIPKLLEGAVLIKLRETAKQQCKVGLIDERTRQQLVAKAATAASEIASVLSVAYSVRGVADYKPEIPIQFEARGFRLNEHSNIQAANWRGRIERHKSILLGVSKELGIV